LINTKIGNLRTQVQDECKKLKAEVKFSSAANRQEQVKAAEKVSDIRDTVLGKGNLPERMKSIEEMVTWCVEHVKLINADRLDTLNKGESPQNMAARIANIKNRIDGAVARLASIKGNADGNQAPNGGKDAAGGGAGQTRDDVISPPRISGLLHCQAEDFEWFMERPKVVAFS
jgi:hypothetical protein